MSVVNAVLGSACGAVFLCDWLVAHSKSPRALMNAERRAKRSAITDQGYHSNANDESTPISSTVAAMKKEDFAKLRNAMMLAIPCMSRSIALHFILNRIY